MCRCDSQGESGVLYVVKLAVHLLDPSCPESSAALVGRLLIVFIKKVRVRETEWKRGLPCARQEQCWETISSYS